VRSQRGSCRLDLTFAQSSEGPAVFIIFIVVAAAALTEVAFHSHPLLHLTFWIPAAVMLSLVLLRPLKATMIGLRYPTIIREDGNPA
jgi:uncharacterized protein (DUF983 family)